MGEPRIVDAVDPEDAFGALSDETRIDVLRALWNADDHEMSFSELREAVGMRDSGQFNYHLGDLVEAFVAKSDGEYELKLAGMRVVGTLLAGAYTMAGSVDPFEIDESCPSCGASMTFQYEDEWVSFECTECPIRTTFGVPPGVFDGYGVDSFPAVADRYGRTLIRQAENGFCPYCEGRVRPTVDAIHDPEESATVPDRFEDLPAVEYECERCDETVGADLGIALLMHPAVVSFYYDHDIDVREDSTLQFGALTNERSRIRDRDPLRATVTYTAADEELTLTVDADMDVLAVERTAR